MIGNSLRLSERVTLAALVAGTDLGMPCPSDRLVLRSIDQARGPNEAVFILWTKRVRQTRDQPDQLLEAIWRSSVGLSLKYRDMSDYKMYLLLSDRFLKVVNPNTNGECCTSIFEVYAPRIVW